MKSFLRPAWGSVLLLIMVIALFAFKVAGTRAEQSGGSPESGATSRIKTLYTDLSALTFGSDSDTPDWGTNWNRIKTAAKWAPTGTAAVSDVVSGKTFYNTTRSAATGTYYAANLSTTTVKNGTTFGVSQTGAYPSASNSLPGDTGATDADASGIKSSLEAWGKDGTLLTGTYPAPSSCSTQQYHDSYGAPVTQTTNCVNTITWTTASPPVTGDDKKDPRTGLVWSQLLLNTAGTVGFSAGSNSSWSWDGSTDADSIAVGGKSATLLCSERGNGWRLPSEKELLQVYIDGSYFNLTQPSNTFWSVTENSSTNAWNVGLNNGATGSYNKTVSFQVRCVR